MSKPSEIEDEIWEKAIHCAETVCRNLPEDYGDLSVEVTAIARTLQAERDHWAKAMMDPTTVRVNYLRGTIACQPLIDEAVATERKRAEKAEDELSRARHPDTTGW